VAEASHQTKVFISYAHKDAHWLDRLRVHLAPLWEGGDVLLWDDTRLEPGTLWENEIQSHLRSARIAILLVSADFLASPFIRTKEIPPLLEAAEAGGTTIIPIIVGPCLFHETGAISRFQAANSPDEPLVALDAHAQEKLLLKVARRVQGLLLHP
jgi:hypothetical protein